DRQHENDQVDHGMVDDFHLALLPWVHAALRVNEPSRVMSVAATMSSSRSILSVPSFVTISFMKSSRLRAYSAEASDATIDARFVYPAIVTPCLTTTSSASVSGQLPPRWPSYSGPRPAARSISTEPGFIACTVSTDSSVGAGRPGISAVEMMTSACF